MTTYDHNVYMSVRTGETNLSTMDAPKETLTQYLLASLDASDDAFIEALDSNIPLPTKEDEIEDIVSKAYYRNCKKSIKRLKLFISKEMLSTLLNDSIDDNEELEYWLDDTSEDHEFRMRLIKDGAVPTKENRKYVKEAMTMFLELSSRLAQLM